MIKTIGFNFGSKEQHTHRRNNTAKQEYPDYSNDSSFKGYSNNGMPMFVVGNIRQCDCCSKQYKVTHWSKRFCSDDCRMEANGFDLENYKKGKYGKKGGGK